MWGDALSLIEQAERLRRHFLRPSARTSPATQSWEPPIDVVENADEIVVQVALPGVPAAAIALRFDSGGVTVSGTRRFPAEQTSRIHRIEIPYGRFDRHIALPLRVLEPLASETADGCLVLTFRKLKEAS